MKKNLAPIAVFSAAMVAACAATPDFIIRVDSFDALTDLACKVCADIAPGGGMEESLKTEAADSLNGFLGSVFRNSPKVDFSKPICFAVCAESEDKTWFLAGVPTSEAEPAEHSDEEIFSAYSDGYSWLSDNKEIISDAALLAEVRAYRGAFAGYPVNVKQFLNASAMRSLDEQVDAIAAAASCGENPFRKLLCDVLKKSIEIQKSFVACDLAYTYAPGRGCVCVSSLAVRPDSDVAKAVLAAPALSGDALAKFGADSFLCSASSCDAAVFSVMPAADEWLAAVPFDAINDAEVSALVSNYVKSAVAAVSGMKSFGVDASFDRSGRLHVTSSGALGDTAAARDAFKSFGGLVRRAAAGRAGVKVEDTDTGLKITVRPCDLCGKCPKAGDGNCAAVVKKVFGDEISLVFSADAGIARGTLSSAGAAAPEASSARAGAMLAALEKEFPGARPVSVAAFSFSRLMRSGLLPAASAADPGLAAEFKAAFDEAVPDCGECVIAGGILGDRVVSVMTVDLPEIRTFAAGFTFLQMKAMAEAAGCCVECGGEEAEFDEEDDADGDCDGGACRLPAPAE